MVNKIVKEVLKRIFCLLPLKNIIIFESNPDFADNTYWFFKYLVEEQEIHKKFQLVWKTTGEKRSELLGVPIICVVSKGSGFKEKCKVIYYICRAKVIIDCNNFVHKVRDSQIRIHLGHGMPVKRPDEYMEGVGQPDLYTITGEGFREYYENFLMGDVIKTYGYPRNDVLLKRKFNISDEKKIIWMPTFRQHKAVESHKISVQFPLGIPVVKEVNDLIRINEYLIERNCYLYLRPHPAQDLTVIKIKEFSNIVILNDNRLEEMNTTLYELLAESDALITDYSSVYYDYLLVKKPIGLTFEDLAEYSEKWDLLCKDVKTELPGQQLQEVEDLLEFIDDVVKQIDRTCEDRETVRKRLGIKQEISSPVIWQYLKSMLER